ncbi:winged helix-turn-helix domain-containing protein [Streptomyces sp. NPDC053079]|uniref:winged helix-turn-helix domain-containing protein n=1 Tax=Streptomyces sp. NPDC053079 TaxID=3365697 RepID=UPI0037D7C93A
MQVAAALHPHRPRALTRNRGALDDIDGALAGARLPLLTALRRDIRGYTPDFMTPALEAECPDLEAELHHVATTPAHVVARQMERLASVTHDTTHGGRGSELPSFRQFLELGESAFAERVASELEDFWSIGLAPSARSLMAEAVADLECRGQTIARKGLGAALDALHPAIAYREGALRMRTPQEMGATSTCRISFFPSPLAVNWMVSIDPWHERGIYLIYPTHRPDGRPPRAREEPAGHPLADVVGRSRFDLLATLGSPRTTTELAALHRFGKSTISYHLSHLHRGGLVSRVRTGKEVYYQRTDTADRLLGEERGERPGPAAPRRHGRAGRLPGRPPAAPGGVVSA